MRKKPQVMRSEVPYAECIIRAGDSRPIVITMGEMGGDCEISQGTADDMAVANTILGIMRSVTTSYLHVRLMEEHYRDEHAARLKLDGEELSGEDSSLPF